ncbi:MurR/RpiR family transcriptional regulator [Heyndrickxia sporothermodurans]|uniref:MurR/RpiR family transcriptional regulator n=1 Tax=Heyndrickxia TaxID=2837504 RepID=UPI000D35886F|nr:MurR/RpiR family transcriptional regulator [Heyndrickxia sporothermodurans]PTY80509.1 MurR/RpiR family transcriptional regulator [Heyndrickxia sporothermodurans]
MTSLLKDIQSRYSSFSDKERQIADYLLSSPDEASQSHIKEIASKTGVSVASITRFAKKVSCRNFVELKLKLAQQTHIEKSDDIDEALQQQYRDMFKDIRALSEKESFMRVLTMIQEANRIFIYGLGSSGLASQELNYRLSRMGFTSEAVTDPHLMVIRSALLKEGDLLLTFSRSGQTRDLLMSIEKARENGVKIVSFTAYGDTPLTALSDEVLWTIHPIRNGIFSPGLDLSALFLIDRMTTHLLQDPARNDTYTQTVSIIKSLSHLNHLKE